MLGTPNKGWLLASSGDPVPTAEDECANPDEQEPSDDDCWENQVVGAKTPNVSISIASGSKGCTDPCETQEEGNGYTTTQQQQSLFQ